MGIASSLVFASSSREVSVCGKESIIRSMMIALPMTTIPTETTTAAPMPIPISPGTRKLPPITPPIATANPP